MYIKLDVKLRMLPLSMDIKLDMKSRMKRRWMAPSFEIEEFPQIFLSPSLLYIII